LAVRAGLEVTLVPTPRHLSSDCGTALRFRWADREALLALLKDRDVDFERVAPISG
jgi:hypothetical protein